MAPVTLMDFSRDELSMLSYCVTYALGSAFLGSTERQVVRELMVRIAQERIAVDPDEMEF